jgi:hypothetical protein
VDIHLGVATRKQIVEDPATLLPWQVVDDMLVGGLKLRPTDLVNQTLRRQPSE